MVPHEVKIALIVIYFAAFLIWMFWPAKKGRPGTRGQGKF